MYAPQKNFVLPQYSLQTDLSKDIDAENLVKIASELSFLDPTEQGDFFVPNLGQKMYIHEKILCCINIAFRLTYLKTLMLRT
jgi:hypothetical protein